MVVHIYIAPCAIVMLMDVDVDVNVDARAHVVDVDACASSALLSSSVRPSHKVGLIVGMNGFIMRVHVLWKEAHGYPNW